MRKKRDQEPENMPVEALVVITMASAVVDTTNYGRTIDVTFTGATALTPNGTTNAKGFVVRVNGIPRPIISALRSANLIYTLTLSSPIKPGDVVTLDYIKKDSDVLYVHESSLYANDRLDLSVTNNITQFATDSSGVPLFDPLLSSSAAIPEGALIEGRIGFPSVSVILDQSPPEGDVVINEYPDDEGIHIHTFTVKDGSEVEITSDQDVIQDRLGYPVKKADRLGGITEEEIVEKLGVLDRRYYVKYFSNLPTIQYLYFCITAAKDKAYSIDIQQEKDGPWRTLIYMIANIDTRHLFDYKLNTAIPICAARVHYLGEYYSTSDTMNIMISGKDDYSGVEYAAVSHYSDFIDATDFPDADGEGFIEFNDGSTEYSWDLVNENKLWTSLGASQGTDCFGLSALSTTLMMLNSDSPKYYKDTTFGSATVLSDDITASVVHNGLLYVGCADGSLYSTPSGITYTLAAQLSSNATISALASYNGKLYVATSEATYSHLYTYASSAFSDAIKEFLEPICYDMCASKGKLFAAVGSETESKAGVYVYNGSVWQKTFSASVNSAQKIEFCTLTNQVLVGLSNGQIYALSFDDDNKPTTWAKLYDSVFNQFVNFYDSADSFFIFGTNDSSETSFVLLTQTNSTNQFLNIEPISSYRMVDAVYIDGQYYLYTNEGSGTLYQFQKDDTISNKKYIYVKLKDRAGNESVYSTDPAINTVLHDFIVQSSATTSGSSTSSGYLYQVKEDKTTTILSSSTPAPLYAPNRILQKVGYLEIEPVYAPNLTSWDELNYSLTWDAISDPGTGMDYGFDVMIYLRSASTRDAVLEEDWVLASTFSKLNTVSSSGSDSTNIVDISSYNGQWIQYKVVLVDYVPNYYFEFNSITLSYTGGGRSVYFTANFHEDNLFRRGLFTANYTNVEGGSVEFGYTTDPDNFNANSYTMITPDKLFEIENPAADIRFGIFFVLDSSLEEFAVQLDTGDEEVILMPQYVLS